MKQTIDAYPFTFLDIEGQHAFCRLRVFEGRHAPVIIVSDVRHCDGPPVADCWDQLRCAVWQMLECPAAGMVCVEHQHGRAADGAETDEFTLVTFTGSGRFERPARRPLHLLELEVMLGANYADVSVAPEPCANGGGPAREGRTI